jgi:hypothetical protein
VPITALQWHWRRQLPAAADAGNAAVSEQESIAAISIVRAGAPETISETNLPAFIRHVIACPPHAEPNPQIGFG